MINDGNLIGTIISDGGRAIGQCSIPGSIGVGESVAGRTVNTLHQVPADPGSFPDGIDKDTIIEQPVERILTEMRGFIRGQNLVTIDKDAGKRTESIIIEMVDVVKRMVVMNIDESLPKANEGKRLILQFLLALSGGDEGSAQYLNFKRQLEERLS